MDALSPEVEVTFHEWALVTEFPARREWGLLNLVVTVSHDGCPDLWEIDEIELEPVFPEQTERHPVPYAWRGLIEAEMRGRPEDREKIRHAISEQLSGFAAAINKRAA